MGDKSKISWTDATWNPVTGCTKVSAGCKNCYAERVSKRTFAGQEELVHPEGATDYEPYLRPRRFTDVRCHPERLDQPLRWRKPRRVFVNSMSDLFHEDVPDEFIAAVFGVMAAASSHTFQVLTKRPERMRQWFEWIAGGEMAPDLAAQRLAFDAGCAMAFQRYLHPMKGTYRSFPWPLPNVWLGVSVENQETADERIPVLMDTQAALRFVSCEPLLGPIDLGQSGVFGHRWLDWVIVGGESGPRYRPMSAAWARSLLDQCREAEIPFFFKQVSGPRPGMGESLLGRKIQEWPAAVQHGGME